MAIFDIRDRSRLIGKTEAHSGKWDFYINYTQRSKKEYLPDMVGDRCYFYGYAPPVQFYSPDYIVCNYRINRITGVPYIGIRILKRIRMEMHLYSFTTTLHAKDDYFSRRNNKGWTTFLFEYSEIRNSNATVCSSILIS